MRFLHTVGTDTNTGWHLFFRGDKPATQANMDALVGVADTQWNSLLAPLTSADTTLTSVKGTDLSSTTGSVSVATAAHVGTRTGGFLPASACVLYNMGIARRYRGGKPRIYIPAGVQTDLGNAQTWAAAFTNSVNTAMNSLIGALATNILTWSSIADLVNISYWESILVTTPPAPPAYAPRLRLTPLVDNIVTHVSSPVVGSQRRRLRPG